MEKGRKDGLEKLEGFLGDSGKFEPQLAVVSHGIHSEITGGSGTKRSEDVRTHEVWTCEAAMSAKPS